MREEQELTDLIELLSLEDASEKIADRDHQSLAGYFKALEEKTIKHVNAYKALKKELSARERKEKKEKEKQLRAEQKEVTKETKKAEEVSLITVYVRLNSQTLTLTFAKHITVGEMRHLIVAMWNVELNQSSQSRLPVLCLSSLTARRFPKHLAKWCHPSVSSMRQPFTLRCHRRRQGHHLPLLLPTSWMTMMRAKVRTVRWSREVL